MIATFPKVFNVFRRSFAQKYIHQYLFKMDKAYLRRWNETEQFEIAFKYVDPELRINRQFNFNRRLSETVDAFLTRVATNFEKVMAKKNKKRKVKAQAIGEDTVEEKKTEVCLFVDSNEVDRHTVCNDVFVANKNIILQIESKKFEIVFNSPWIEAVSLPSSMLATFPVYPSKFETFFTEKELSTFIWSKSVDKKTWTNIAGDYICIPSNEEIGQYLKLSCTPKNSSYEGPCTEVISESKVEASPGKCPFEIRHEFTKQRATGNE